MSNLSTAVQLKSIHSQLPVSAYFDQALLGQEIETLFKRGPRYIGHELMVPEIGDYYALPGEAEGRALVRNGNSIELLSNVCRHRQAIMLNGRGHVENIVCPLQPLDLRSARRAARRPAFSGQSLPESRPHAAAELAGHAVRTERPPTSRAISRISAPVIISIFRAFQFDHAEMHECNYNWKTFIEVYLEDYHVVPFHPGLGSFVSCDDLQWEFGAWYSVQTVGVHQGLAKPGSPTYRKWHDAVLNFRKGAMPEFGAIWMVYYPGLMIEWYPHVLVVSWLIPRGPQQTTNIVEFYYPEEIALFEREFVEAERAAIWKRRARTTRSPSAWMRAAAP